MKRESVKQQLARTTHEQRTRRHFLQQSATGLAGIWMAAQSQTAAAELKPQHSAENPLDALSPPQLAKVKRVIYLHMVGGPSQLELFDYKPDLDALDGKDCPQSFLAGKRFAFINGTPKMLGHQYKFAQYGESGAWVSDRLPHLATCVDQICFIKTVQTEQFNHGPAQLLAMTGSAQMGSPSIGSWVTWGLGTENSDLPGFIVLLSGGRQPRAGKALWSGGFLPSVYQGIQCQSKGDPVLNVSNPAGVTRDERRRVLDALENMNRQSFEQFGDPETLTRIAQYEMAFRMQIEAPKVMTLNDESAETIAAYGAEPGKESFANNCLLARRLVENGVRFVQLFDWGWDSHGAAKEEALDFGFNDKCMQMDRPVAALLKDLQQRGLLEDTLVVWGAEFGRTPMRENRGGGKMAMVGRDHSPDAFTMWMAGAGVKPGITYGETDPVGYTAAINPVNTRDFHATLLHMLGFDPHQMSVPFKGLDQKLIGVKQAQIIKDILSVKRPRKLAMSFKGSR